MFIKGGLLLSVFLIAVSGAPSNSVAEPEVVCYVGTWATYRQGLGKYDTAKIDPFSCTELVYAFFGISGEGEITILDPWLDLEDDGGIGNIKKFNDLKQVNPALKTIAAVGGWNAGSTNFSVVANDETLRNKFAASVVTFLQKYGFNGVDIDWEYPMRRNDLGYDDRNNFNLLLKALKDALSPLGLLLSIAVSATESQAVTMYNIPEMYPLLDRINIMAYDLHLGSDPVTGFNAPLKPAARETTALARELNVLSIVQFWTSVVPPQLLTLGTPFYGHNFRLTDPANTAPGAPSSGPGPAGPFSQEAGTISYNELCNQWQTEVWNKTFDNEQEVPYAVKDDVWVSYENPTSIILKAQLAMSFGLGGVMTWSLENDDFNGLCGEGNSPLLAALNEGVGREIPSSETSAVPPSAEPDVTTEVTTEVPPVTATLPPLVELSTPTRPPRRTHRPPIWKRPSQSESDESDESDNSSSDSDESKEKKKKKKNKHNKSDEDSDESKEKKNKKKHKKSSSEEHKKSKKNKKNKKKHDSNESN